ncbi:MAG: hypothetical protein QXS93_02320 [Candidatus Micrarchaeia archaeon]
MGLELVGRCLQNAVNFINSHLMQVLPFCVLFFIAVITYSICWYALDIYKDVACLSDNYILSLLFCRLYLGALGKEIIAVVVSSFSIIPLAALIYLVHKIVNNDEQSILGSIRESIPGIAKIIVFRFCLVIVLFLPFIVFIAVGGDIIKERITDTGRLTVEKLLTWPLIFLPLTLFLGFALWILLYPVFQYVEYEVLVLGARVRDAINNSFSIAMKHKTETFGFGLLFIAVWCILIFTKLLYSTSPLLAVSLIAAIFIESFFVFPLWAIALYFLWSALRSGHKKENKNAETKVIKSYMDKMMLG